MHSCNWGLEYGVDLNIPPKTNFHTSKEILKK